MSATQTKRPKVTARPFAIVERWVEAEFKIRSSDAEILSARTPFVQDRYGFDIQNYCILTDDAINRGGDLVYHGGNLQSLQRLIQIHSNLRGHKGKRITVKMLTLWWENVQRVASHFKVDPVVIMRAGLASRIEGLLAADRRDGRVAPPEVGLLSRPK